jgi:glycosyltransferase involved in cell wall biosynthesis
MTDYPSDTAKRPCLHVVSMPHTETTREYDWCAFNGETRKFVNMMTSLGYDVRLYAGEVNEAVCTEHIPIVSRAEQKKWFPNLDLSKDVFADWNPNSECWQVMNRRAAEEIRRRSKPGDVLGLVMGSSQKLVAELLKDAGLYEVEIFIGHTAPVSPFRVWTSYALRHFLADRVPNDNVRPFDAVIPNFFEVGAFPEGKGDGEYYLFLGRATRRKGPLIAAEVCRQIGAKLVVAGPLVVKTNPVTTAGGYILEGNVEYVGMADPARRAELMGRAKAVLLPTIYLEPFGNVAVEAMLCGTPAITSDWGGYTETVLHGVTGFRCNTIDEYAEAALRVGELDRKAIRKYAIERYSTEAVGPQYDKYFQRLAKGYPKYVEQQKEDVLLNLAAKERVVLFDPTATHFVDLSAAYYQTGQYEKSIASARTALTLQSDFALALINICAANNSLGNFSEGKVAGEEALRLQPNNQLAKNNLDWSIRELIKQ